MNICKGILYIILGLGISATALSQQNTSSSLSRNGAINIFNNLNVRNAPSLGGTVIRQSFFGDIFDVYETVGSGRMENGVLDLWYKISPDTEEWVNGLYLRFFPFYIASDGTADVTDINEPGFRTNQFAVRIEGYRETNEAKEIMIIARAYEVLPRLGEGFYPVDFSGFVKLQEKYVFSPPQTRQRTIDYFMNGDVRGYDAGFIPEYKISLLDNTFNNLVNFSSEINKIGQQIILANNDSNANRQSWDAPPVNFYIDGVQVTQRRLYYGLETIITINSRDIALSGVSVGSSGSDIIALLGDNYSANEDHVIRYNLGEVVFGVLIKIEFILNDDTITEIIYHQISLK